MMPIGAAYLGHETRGSPPLVKEDHAALVALPLPSYSTFVSCDEVQCLQPTSTSTLQVHELGSMIDI